MAGHISYPRAAAAIVAWSDYRHAITLANAGAADASKSLLRAILDDPNASPYLKRLAAELLTKLNSAAISDARASLNLGTKLEGQVAQLVMDAGINIVSFNREVGPNGEIGEIDTETPKAIIETTTKVSRKLAQVKTLMTNVQINPNGKPIILYAPNYGGAAGNDIVKAGGLIARTPEELMSLLHSLGDS